MRRGSLVALVWLTACSSSSEAPPAPAPIVELSPERHLATAPSRTAPIVIEAKQSRNDYRVQKGDTLYSIAWAYQIDYRRLARANHLSKPYEIHPGQPLSLNLSQASPPEPEFVYHPTPAKSSVRPRHAVHWAWPVRGAVISRFSRRLAGNQGIDISGKIDEPVRAAAPGVVVYAGSGLRGYGKLIILKHSDRYLSAYAFNRTLQVQPGEQVKAGQVIAQMGRNNLGQAALHFEIRQDGKPINPLSALA